MKKKLIIILPIAIAAAVFFFTNRYYNKEDKTTTLTISEKRWVEKNNDKTYDFEVVNDYPLYAMNGEGVIFNFIKDFEDTVGIEFNIIPYLKTSSPSTDSYRIEILKDDTKLSENNLLLLSDNYIIVGKNYERINNTSDMKNITFGVFESDAEEVSYYLKGGTNLSYKQYKSITELYDALDKDEVNMIVMPNIMYLDYTIEKDKYFINYYLTEMQTQLVLTLSDNNKELNKIVTKYYNKWRLTKYVDEYNESYLNYYVQKNNISAKTKASLISKNYTYGYISNAPYEVKVNGKAAGIAGEYIDRIARLADINFKYKEYKSKEELQKVIDEGKIDVYFDYYNYNNDKYYATLSTFIEEYVVLGYQKDNHIVTSFESLKGKDIAILEDDSLYNYFSTNSKANIKGYKNIDELLSKNTNELIVLDREVYNYYQTTKLKNYNLLYLDTMMNDYKFMVKKDNEAFFDLFNYIINTNSYYNYRNSGLENLHASILEDSTFEQAYTITLAIVFIPLTILVTIYLVYKQKRKIKKVKTTERHKYTDMLTSLKNRNYLNAKMPEWEASEVYPQAIVMVDLNNVKFVNDNFGHEEGDQLIIKAAGILVNTQLENSEIIRTDGNEFLVYLVGYSERQVDTYAKKLAKEMKALPHEFGAAVGYSMIQDKIKTLDDAINEATIEMIANKEDLK